MMIRDMWARTTWLSRALVATTMVALLVSTGSVTIAAAPSPRPSTSIDAGLCPAGHVVATAPDAAPSPAVTATAVLKGPPRSDGVPRPPMLEAAPTDVSLGGRWSDLPTSPFAAANAIALWAGDRVVAIDPWSGRTATYDPPTRRWEEHQPLPGENPANGEAISGPPVTAWTGREVVMLGYRDRPQTIVSIGYAFDPTRGRWRRIAPPPIDGAREAAMAGGLLVATTRDRQAAAYDPAADCWLPMPDVPLPELPANDRTMGAMEWSVDHLVARTGDGLLAVVHSEEPEVGLGVVAFDPQDWTWDPGPLGPLASGSNAILVDDRLWFMDRSPNDRWLTNGTYDPATESWTVLDTGCRLYAGIAVWTGRLIMEPLYARRAYDPATGACYRLPKHKDRARYVLDPVWTGREYVVWSGSWGDSGIGRPDGIVYRPSRRAITGEPAKPIGRALRSIIEARGSAGFDTDPGVVRAIRRDPYQPDSRQYGFPMTEAEAQDILARNGWSGRATSIRPWLRKQEGFGGIWIDQRDGGAIAIAFTEADPEVIREIDRRFAPFDGPTPWKLVIVPRSYEELRDAFRRAGRISRAIDPDAMLWSVGLDESGGVISLLYDPDDVGRMRTKKTALERRLGVPVRIEGGRVRDT